MASQGQEENDLDQILGGTPAIRSAPPRSRKTTSPSQMINLTDAAIWMVLGDVGNSRDHVPVPHPTIDGEHQETIPSVTDDPEFEQPYGFLPALLGRRPRS